MWSEADWPPAQVRSAPDPGLSFNPNTVPWPELFIFIYLFSGPHLWPMEVPRLGVEIRTVAASLRYRHSNAGSEPCLQATPQLVGTPDP